MAPSEFESFLDDYLMSTVEGGGAVPGDSVDKQQLRQQLQQEQGRQGPAAQLRSNPLASRLPSHQPATSPFIPTAVFRCTGPPQEGSPPTHPTACMHTGDAADDRAGLNAMICSCRSAPEAKLGLPALPLSPPADGAGSRAASGEAAQTALRSSSGDSAGPSSPPRKGGGKSSAAKRTLELQEKNRRVRRLLCHFRPPHPCIPVSACCHAYEHRLQSY